MCAGHGAPPPHASLPGGELYCSKGGEGVCVACAVNAGLGGSSTGASCHSQPASQPANTHPAHSSHECPHHAPQRLQINLLAPRVCAAGTQGGAHGRTLPLVRLQVHIHQARHLGHRQAGGRGGRGWVGRCGQATGQPSPRSSASCRCRSASSGQPRPDSRRKPVRCSTAGTAGTSQRAQRAAPSP